MSDDESYYVNYQALADGESQINQISGRIEEALHDLKRRLGQIHWEGGSKDAYQGYQAQWDRAITDLNVILTKAGGLVGSAHGNYLNNETSNINLWNANG